MTTEKLELDDMQGIIARGYGNLPAARFLILAFPEDAQAARRWLGAIADAVTPAGARPGESAVHIALTASGLEQLGLQQAALAGFSHEFREGMTTPHRQRQLGDTGDNAPGNWTWGGPGAPEVHAVLLLYARDAAAMNPLVLFQIAAIQSAGLAIIADFETSPVLDREPFGFRDGISQPFIEGLGKTGDANNTVRAGEFVLGYENEYGLLTDSPRVAATSDRAGVLARTPGNGDTRDLGRNGSYLVFRQLEQDVAGFWRHIDSVTHRDGGPDPAAREYLAAKMVGRWPSGASLVESPHHDDPGLAETNDFGYHERDADGMRCPVGAHVRRANPRDSLDPNPGTADSYKLNKRHRLLRRGRPYGTRLTLEQVLAGQRGEGSRGIHFICVSANISRQFEFVQQTWINNPKFGEQYDDIDPLLGTRGPGGATFTVPAEPVRERHRGLPSFVTVRGGAYFFLPGIRALKYLANLG